MADILKPEVLKQDAVLWAKIGDDENGSPIYDDPYQIKCRWEDVQERFVDTAGEDQVSNAKVLVDRDIPTGSILILGELANIDYPQEPLENPGAYAVRAFSKIPNRRANKFLRQAIM